MNGAGCIVTPELEGLTRDCRCGGGAVMNEPCCYVYGIAQAAPEPLPAPPGIGGAAVVGITAGDLVVVVSESDELGPDPTEENALAHHNVLTAVMKARTVVPFAFGYVLPRRLLARLAESVRSECLRLLPELTGKVEVGLKLFWTKESLLPDIETPEIGAALAAAAASRGLAAHVGELVEAAVNRKRAEYVRQIFEPLAVRAAAARLNETAGPRMVLNAAFLIDQSGEAEFDARVGEVCAAVRGRLEARYTGPWPPYNFVSLRVQLEEGEE